MYLWNKTSPSNLGGYRPNQAMDRVYAGWSDPRAMGPLSGPRGLGAFDDEYMSVDPKLLFAGLGLLAAGMFLFGGRAAPKMRARKVARLKRRRDSLSRQLASLGA